MIIVFLKLLIAHVLGDFVLQPKKWVINRRANVVYLFAHVTVHAALLCLFFYNELSNYGLSIAFITATHLAIDSLKIWWEKVWTYKPIRLFLADQALHLIMLALVLYYHFPQLKDYMPTEISADFLAYALAILLLVFSTPIFLRIFFTKWQHENTFHSKREDSLLDAGMIIGIIERLLILFFILIGIVEAIGFLLAAKSIFRFGDLTNAKDTKFTEYILVGTLLSFSIAIFVGYALKAVLDYLP